MMFNKSIILRAVTRQRKLSAICGILLAASFANASAITFVFDRSFGISSTGAANNAAFVQDIAVTSTGSIFVADPFSNNDVRELNSTGNATIRAGGNYSDRPSGLTMLANGNLLIGTFDGTPAVIEANPITLAPISGGISFGSRLRIGGIAEHNGNIIVAGYQRTGSLRDYVRTYNTSGGIISNFAFSQRDASGIVVNPENGNLLIGSENNRIYEYEPDGTYVGQVMSLSPGISGGTLAGLAYDENADELFAQFTNATSGNQMEVQVFSRFVPPVPEPSTGALSILAAGLLLVRRSRA